MITSKHIIKISEDWDRSVSNSSMKADIFKNPGSSDYTELHKKSGRYVPIRFIADAKTNNIYVWDADRATHEQVSRALGFYGERKGFDEPPYAFDGYGTLSQNTINGEEYHGTFRNITDIIKDITSWGLQDGIGLWVVEDIEPIFKYNWSFVDRYVVGFSSIINKLKTQYFDLVKKHGYKRY